MTRRCRGCGHRLHRPSVDGYGPVCRVRLAGTLTTTALAAPSASAAGQLPLEDHMPKNPNAHLPHDRRAVEPDGTVHAARFCPGGFTTACAVYPAPVAAELVAAPTRAVTCTGCQTALATAKEDTMTDTTPTLRYTDDDAVTLTVLPIPDASSYYGPIPVVSLGIVDHRWDDDAEPAIVHVRLDAVDQLIAALSKARCVITDQVADRVVAYRVPGQPLMLLCPKHGEQLKTRLTPVTSEGLPDGGLCTWHDCGVDVLIDPADPAPSTRQCGHGDYHGAHEWADRPGTWCPGWTDA